MTEEVAAVKTLKDSKLYALRNSGMPMLEELLPPIDTQILSSAIVDNQYARKLGNKSKRIFINYINTSGRSVLYPLAYEKGLDSTFDIDAYLNGYMRTSPGDADLNLETLINATIFTVLNTAVVALLELDTVIGQPDPKAKQRITQTAMHLLTSLCSIIYNDPDDVIIMFTQSEGKEEHEVVGTITNMWSTN